VDNPPLEHQAAAGATTWGIRPPVFAALGAALLLAITWAVLAGTAADRLVAVVVAVAAVVTALCCLPLRRRLTADRRGLIVRGPGGTRQVHWPAVTSISTARRSHLGIGSTSLEIDLDDDGLIVLGRFDLGADPEEVAAELKALQRG
jgi:hypothetical protein